MGELRKRGRVWWIRYYRNGQRHEESSRSRLEGVARRLLQLREGDIAKGLPVSAGQARYSFDDAAEAIETDYRVNARKSAASVTRRLTLHLKPWFGGRRLGSVTTSDVQAYTRHRLDQGAASATINRELAALKRIFVLAMRAGHVLHRPYIPLLAEHNTRTGFFEREAFLDVRAKLPADVQPVITFAYYTGWRIPSEVLTLEWRQVDQVAQVVRLEAGQTKNGRGREFPYGALPDLVTLVADQWATHERLRKAGMLCPFVFHRGGRPIKHFRDSWRAACAAAGVPGRIPHDFRRTAVRNLVRAGVSERVAMTLTGHLTRSVFDRYNVVSGGDQADAVAKLATAAAGTKQGQSTTSATVVGLASSVHSA